jgi:tetratricopeptide (TPR) repeat protein
MAGAGTLSGRADCLAAAQKAAAMFRALGDRCATYHALCTGAAIGSRRGAFDEVAAAIAEADSLEDPAWPAYRRTRLCLARYLWCLMDGRYEEAIEAMRRQDALYREDRNAIGAQLVLGNIAMVLVATGQSELAERTARQAIARLEELGAGASAGHVTYSLSLALLNLGRHGEMLEAARKAHALLQREGDHHLVLEPLALCAALQGRPADAGVIVGFVDALYAKSGDVRRHPQRMRRERIDALLATGLADDEHRTLYAEGATMPEDEVFALALKDSESNTTTLRERAQRSS